MHHVSTSLPLLLLGWVRRENPHTSFHQAMAFQSLSPSMFHRKLDYMDAGLYNDGSMDELFDKTTLDRIDQCGVDLNAVMNAFEPFLMAAIENVTQEDQLSSLFFDFVNEVADDGEEDCTDEQLTQFVNAAAEYVKCIGWHDVEVTPELLDEIQDACETSLDPMEPMAGVEQCLDTVLGDNAIGDILRELYHHPGKICGCFPALYNDLPKCILSCPNLDNVRFPLSFIKKEICLLEIGCDAIDGACVDEIKSLDACLPPAQEDEFSCMKIVEKCELLESPPLSILAPPELTMGQLPDSCERVYRQSLPDTDIVERYTNFNAVCNNDSVETVQASIHDEQSSARAPFMLVAVLLLVAAGVAAFKIVKKRRGERAVQWTTKFDPVIEDEDDLI